MAVIRTDKSEKKNKQAKPNLCEFLLLIIQATCSLFKICQIICAHIGAHHTQIDHIFLLIKVVAFWTVKVISSQKKQAKKRQTCLLNSGMAPQLLKSAAHKGVRPPTAHPVAFDYSEAQGANTCFLMCWMEPVLSMSETKLQLTFLHLCLISFSCSVISAWWDCAELKRWTKLECVWGCHVFFKGVTPPVLPCTVLFPVKAITCMHCHCLAKLPENCRHNWKTIAEWQPDVEIHLPLVDLPQTWGHSETSWSKKIYIKLMTLLRKHTTNTITHITGNFQMEKMYTLLWMPSPQNTDFYAALSSWKYARAEEVKVCSGSGK